VERRLRGQRHLKSPCGHEKRHARLGARLVPLPARRRSMPAGEFFAQLARIGGADPGLRDDLRQILTETTDDVEA
jgi:hypothetical protein